MSKYIKNYQSIIDSSRPAISEKFKNLNFSDVVTDINNILPAEYESLDFSTSLKENYKVAATLSEDKKYFNNGTEIPDFINSFIKIGNAFKDSASISAPVGTTSEEWTPSYIFPTFKFVNQQMFGPKQIIICRNEKIQKSLVNAANSSNYVNPITASGAKQIYTGFLEEAIAGLIDNYDSCLSRFLILTYLVYEIVKPQTKVFKQDAPTLTNVNALRTDAYTNISAMVALPSKFKLQSSMLHEMYDKYFKGWLNDMLTNDVKYINLFPFASDETTGIVKDSIMSTIFNIVFGGSKSSFYKNAFPVVIDKQFGEYSTVDSILEIINAVQMKTVSPVTRTKFATESILGDVLYSDVSPIMLLGAEESLYGFDLIKYSSLFAEAVSEILSASFWEDIYNVSVGVHCVIDNMLVNANAGESTGSNNETTNTNDNTDSADNQASRSIETFESYADNNKNDIRRIVRDNSKQNMIIGLNDYNWSMNTQSLTEMGLTTDDFQHLTIWEFQPDPDMSYKKVVDGAIDKLSGLGAGLFGAAGKTAIQKTVIETMTKGISEVQQFSTDVSWVDNLLSGYYISQFEVPYFGNKFISADTADDWELGNIASNSNFLVNDLTMNVQDIPTWQYKNITNSDDLELDIYLLNENINDVIRNMKFLFSLAAGAYWIQTSVLGYRSPNLYRIFCPGRFLMLYAAMAVNIEFFGKIRRYSNQDAIKLFGTDATQFLPLNIMIKQQKSCNIPEAYKVSLRFKDLTPNAFNIMAAYFTNSEQSSSGAPTNIFPTINVHRERSDAVGQALGKLEEKITPVLEDFQKNIEGIMKDLVPTDS